MNSLQLIGKIKDKSEDLQIAVQELNGELLPIQKELLKKNCIELFELVLKLKTAKEITEDNKSELNFEEPVEAIIQPIIETNLKPEFQLEFISEAPAIVEVSPEPEKEAVIPTPIEVKTEIVEEPLSTTHIESEITPENSPIQQSFNDFIKQINLEKATLNDLEKTAENVVEIAQKTATETKENIPTKEESETGNFYYITPPEFNIDKAVENKRIQKTVMPDPEPLRKVSLNDSVSNLDSNFNDRFAERVNSLVNPIVEKSIDSPIENMKTEIGLNKKIAFVNQLFAENVVEYAKAIDKLNQAPNIEEGLKLFSELGKQFAWDAQNNPLVAELKQLLHRRHQA